jgi:dolichol kinase
VDDPRPDIESSYRIEIIRKAIHLCSLSIPIIYLYTPRNVALGILIPLTLVFVTVDVVRYYHEPVGSWFYTSFGWLLRKRESDSTRKRLNGATYVLVAATVSVLIFPKLITITSFAILIIADLTAALVGRRWGRRPFLAKSVEGSTAFFLSALVVVCIVPKIEYRVGEYIVGAVGALVGAVVEALPWELDDNLTIPISVGLTIWVGYTLALPELDLYRFG